MNFIDTSGMLGVMLFGGFELLVLLFVLLVTMLVVASIVVAVIVLTRNRKQPTPAPPTVPPAPPVKKFCPQCHQEMPSNVAEGLCPACLMKAAMGTQPGAGTPPAENAPSGWTIEDIRKAFPQFEIIELLGQGGMGMVYKARQPQLDRFVALKVLSPELSKDPAFAERFSREAKALARLNHPNIVTVFDFGKAGEIYYFVMEFVDGMNLWQLEQAKKRLSPEEAFAIVPRICDALQYAHDEGVVHRDIKPGNILIDNRGRVKIADFGLAKIVHKDAAHPPLTQPKVTMGTLQYMAPEQMETPMSVDHRADIYSLGVVFYEMLTGELPMGRFAPPSEKVQVDVRMDEVVLRALEREPARRYQQVSEIKERVETVSAGPEQSSAESETPTTQSSSAIAWAIAAVVLVLALIGGGIWLGKIKTPVRAAAAKASTATASAAAPAATAINDAGGEACSDVVVHSAAFGRGTHVVDVTARVIELLRTEPKGFSARNDWLHADPLPYNKKTLVINYDYQGKPYTLMVHGGSKVSCDLLIENAQKKMEKQRGNDVAE